MNGSTVVTRSDLRVAYRDAGLAGSPLCVHSSLKSFGRVEGGAATVVLAALDEGCTFLVPTFSFTFAIPPPPHMQPARNGYDYANPVSDPLGVGRIFTPGTDEMTVASMGAIPAAVLRVPGRFRGNHPLNSFSATGPLAHELIDRQTPDTVYGPLARLAELEGSVVLMGVGLTSMTILHLAERLAGRTMFRRWANGFDGAPLMMQVGGCSTAFGVFADILAPFETKMTVGRSEWRVFAARGALDAATEAIRRDPNITHCGRNGCRCDDAVLGGPILS